MALGYGGFSTQFPGRPQSVSHDPRFLKAPLSSRTVAFRESGWRSQLSLTCFLKARRLKRRLASTPHPLSFTPAQYPCVFCFTRFLSTGTGSSDTRCDREPLRLFRALPLAVWGRAPHRRALPLLHCSYGLMRQTTSLLPTSFTYSDRSSQVAVCPCCDMALPDVISANPSPRAWTHTPVALVVLLPVSSHKASAFPVS